MAAPPLNNLEAILATLSQFTNSSAVAGPGPASTQTVAAPAASQHVQIQRDYRDYSRPQSPAMQSSDPRPQPQRRANTPAQKPIDPATLTTWQDGLRCVTKIAAQNAQFGISVKRMMDDQKRHELRWYKDRQALKQSQVSRATAFAKAQAILYSLGSTSSSEPPNTISEIAKQAELDEYDRKIYAAQLSMEQAMTVELKSLGVPFFGTREDLIVPTDAEQNHPDTFPLGLKVTTQVTKAELLDLQKRMIQHLEDLYRE